MPAASIRTGNDTRPRGRVLIVDDSAVARAVIGRAVGDSDTFQVAGAVPNAHAALAFLGREAVDFVLLDIEMPGVDGLTALPDIIKHAGSARVVVVSSADEARLERTLHALALGAVDRIAKPGPGALTGAFGERLIARMEALAGEAVASPQLPRLRHQPLSGRFSLDPTGYDVVAIGASTGGIHALSALLRALPQSMQLPILITQHLPATFMPYFAAQVAVLGGRPCEVAVDRLRLLPGRIVVAPGDAHLRCIALPEGAAAVRLHGGLEASGCMPSVDPMLRSLADIYGARVLAVMLSGMGRDGADGARTLHAAGGTVLAQDRASSVVWGMPGAVADIAAAQLDPAGIGALLAGLRKR